MNERISTLSHLILPLLEWFRDNQRTLPWRSDPTPYHVWVSEIMLQQTRVAAVLGYYRRFMEALPTVADLAQVEEDQLLKLWQGLGYYNRARNLQKAARQIMEQFGGQFPRSYPALLSLAGVGDYTAGAIASIAFGLPEPAVDGNVLRVVTRITGDPSDISQAATKKVIRAALAEVIPLQAPGDFNQALMELGALVCLPNGAPDCAHCPAHGFCAAHLTGKTAQIPVKGAKKPRKIEERTVYLLFHCGQVALRRRPATGLLAGLWEFPHVEGELDEAAAAAQLAEWHVTPLRWEQILHAKHEFTHLRWRMTGYLRTAAGEGEPDWLWADAAARQQRAIPSAFQVFTAALDGSTAEE